MFNLTLVCISKLRWYWGKELNIKMNVLSNNSGGMDGSKTYVNSTVYVFQVQETIFFRVDLWMARELQGDFHEPYMQEATTIHIIPNNICNKQGTIAIVFKKIYNDQGTIATCRSPLNLTAISATCTQSPSMFVPPLYFATEKNLSIKFYQG